MGQCDAVTNTKIALRGTYVENRNVEKLLAFIERMRTVCFGGDDGGLSYGPYIQIVAIKLLNTYTNNDPQDPHGFKEQVKIKYKATKAIVGNFPNGTAALMELLSNAQVPLDWAGYCALPEEDQLVWELRANPLNQSMLYLVNSKNENTKKDLRLAYSQRNNTVHPPNIKSMARYLSTQYPNNKPANQRGGNKGNKRKGDDPKSEDKDSNTNGAAYAHVEDTTTNDDTTAPSGGASLGAHVSETNQVLSCPSHTVDEILEAYPINDDFWNNTKPTDVSIDTVNSEKKMAGSHITKFHTHDDEQPVVTDLLSKGIQDYDNQPTTHDS